MEPSESRVDRSPTKKIDESQTQKIDESILNVNTSIESDFKSPPHKKLKLLLSENVISGDSEKVCYEVLDENRKLRKELMELKFVVKEKNNVIEEVRKRTDQVLEEVHKSAEREREKLFASCLEKQAKLVELEKDKESLSYLKFCEIIRNKIASFDAYVYHPVMSPFRINPEQLIHFHDYNSRNKEKRRLRLLFLFKNYVEEYHPDIHSLVETYRAANLSDEYFAHCLAEGYSKLSVIIKNITQSVVPAGIHFDRLTDDPHINNCLSMLKCLIECNVGEMQNIRPLE